MILKEFDLDLPYIENEENIKILMNEQNYSYSEAKKIDYSNTWKEKRRNFNLQTRCITAMFERLFIKFKTDDCEKLIVECVNEITNEKIINYLGVYTIQVKFDYNSFMEKSDYDKKIETLELLFQGIEKVIQCKGWDIKALLETKEQIIKLNYFNEWRFKRPIKSPNKKYIAEVLCKHEVENFIISLTIKDFNQNIIKYKYLIEKPHEFAYAKYLGKVEWISNNNASLINKKGDIVISLDI